MQFKNADTSLECLEEGSRRNIMFLSNSKREQNFARKIYPEAQSLLFPNSAFIRYEDFTLPKKSIVHNKIDPVMVVNSKGLVLDLVIQACF